MSQLTRKSIIDFTLKLAETKPVRKITVREIVTGCGITRNTFYYHFHDILDVFEAAISEEIEKVLNEETEDYEEAFMSLIAFSMQYKKVWRNLYNSVGHDNLSAFITRRIHTVMMQYINKQSFAESISETDMEIICTFYEEALFGIMVKWLKSSNERTTEEVADLVNRIRKLFNGTLELVFKNAEEK